MKKALKTFAVLLLALMLWDAWLTYFHIPGWAPLFISDSPDGRFSVSGYYNLPSPFFGEPNFFEAPWSSGGTFVLRDDKTGKVLVRKRMDHINVVDNTVSWFECTRHLYPKHKSCVYIDSIGTWPLPPEEPEK